MGNEREIFIEIFRFLRDWDNHAATIFNRSQSAYLENMQQTVDKVSFGHGCSKGCALELESSRRNLFPATCKKPDL